jgi:hypothetical protein
MINKYFNRIRTLLKDKLIAIKNHISLNIENNRRTKTYIWFSSGEHMIYLGFHLICYTNSCKLLATYVMFSNRWHCMAHSAQMQSVIHKNTTHLVKDPHFFKNPHTPKLVKPNHPYLT